MPKDNEKPQEFKSFEEFKEHLKQANPKIDLSKAKINLITK